MGLKKAILGGDCAQLPPTVISRDIRWMPQKATIIPAFRRPDPNPALELSGKHGARSQGSGNVATTYEERGLAFKRLRLLMTSNCIGPWVLWLRSVAGNLYATIHLSIGSRVMLLDNLWMQRELFNG